MPTPSQIDEQVRLERNQIKQGIELLNKTTKKLEDKSYSSASIYGVTTLRELLPIVREQIRKGKDVIRRGHNGIAFKDVYKYINDLDDGLLAAITCKIVIDKVFSSVDKANYLCNISSSIGSAVEDECHISFYEETVPGLLDYIQKNYWHKACGTHQKVVVLRTLMNRYNVETWNRWPAPVRVRLGGWLLDCLVDSSGWFEKDRAKGRKAPNIMVPTERFLAIKIQITF